MTHALTMALDIVERIDGAASIAEACRSFFHALTPLGARSLILQDSRVKASPLTGYGAYPPLFHAAPPGWIGTPEAEFVDEFNPNPAACAALGRPFRWREATLPTRALEGTYWESVRFGGATDGFCVPVFGPRACVAGVSMAFGRADFGPHEERAIQVAGYALMERVFRLAREGNVERPRLSGRERDCLGFVAQGKSEWEISVILSISRATVHTHVEHAKTKLGARTRAQAVAQAISLGLI